jgi:hypothetical protein
MFQITMRLVAVAALALASLAGCEINNPAPVAAAPAPASVVVQQPAAPAPGTVVVQPTTY